MEKKDLFFYITKYKEDNKYKNRDLAKIFDVDESNFSFYMKGKKNPKKIKLVLNVLKVLMRDGYINIDNTDLSATVFTSFFGKLKYNDILDKMDFKDAYTIFEIIKKYINQGDIE